MSTMLHPTGPEPDQTYWLRRAVVLVALLLVVALLVWVLARIFGDSQTLTADPATSAVATVAASTPTPSPASSTPEDSPVLTPTPSATAAATTSITSAAATPSATTASATTASATTASATTASQPSVAAGPAVCDPSKVVPVIAGAGRVNTGQTVNLRISLTSAVDCVLDFAIAPLEVRIYSGSDRIWSTNDCSTFKPAGKATLGPTRAWAYTIPWNTKRSMGDCRLGDGFLQPGTYVATAVLSGGEPRQHVMAILA